MDETVIVGAWLVHDSGLVAAPGPFRRLAGRVRHHQDEGVPWPTRLRLSLTRTELVVEGVGRWRRADAHLRVIAQGPPVTFVLEVPGSSQLLAAPADPSTADLVAALTASPA